MRGSSKHLLPAALIVLVSAITLTLVTARHAETTLRTQLLNHAHLVAAAVNIERIKNLTGSEADLSSFDYQRLKEQLSAVRHADPSFRFLYLLGRNERGEIFFFVDSEPPDSRDYSPPGQRYEDASPELERLFDEKNPLVEGPLDDEWGTWVSALVPLIDPQTGKTLSVFGIDVDAHNWRWQVLSQAAVPIIGVLLIALLLLAWLNNFRHLRIMQQQHFREEVLSDLRQFLQTCSTMSEAGPITERALRRLFSHSSGVLYLMSASRSDLEPIARWGRHEEESDQNLLLIEECWGLRRGRAHRVRDPRRDLVCAHLSFDKNSPYLCLPLSAYGEVLGVLHLCETPNHFSRKFLDDFEEIAGEVGEILSLALANIKLREKLFSQSIKDPLTGVFNRRYLEETFARETSRARRHQYPIGIIMCDIDHFKRFNDLYGHAAGDAILAEVGRFLARNLRTADIVCRYGGEEFALILPEASLEHTQMRAEELCRRAREIRVTFEDRTLGPITLSFGVAAYPTHGNTLDAVLRAADMALYRAKQEGRDRVVVTSTAS